MVTRLLVQLTQAQYDFCHSDALYRALVGGRGGGKTFSGCYDMLKRAKPNRLYGVYAPTFRMLEDSTLRTFQEMAESMQYLKSWRRGDMKATLGNGAEILFRSLDDPEKARGPNLAGAYMDEASLVPQEAFEIIIAALRSKGEMGWLSATFTPKGMMHWTYEVFGRAKPNTALFKAPTMDNPFLPKEFMQAVAEQYTSFLAQQELHGEFIDAEGAIAKRSWFLPIVDAAPPWETIVRYWDFAATRSAAGKDPDFTVGTKMSRSKGVYYIEHVQRGRYAPGEVETLVSAVTRGDGRRITIGIEQEPGSAGKLFSGTIIRLLAGYHIRAIRSTGDKIQRTMPFIAQAEAGNVKLVRGPWNDDWLDEITSVPNVKHEDQWDSAGGAFNMLTRGGWSKGPGG